MRILVMSNNIALNTHFIFSRTVLGGVNAIFYNKEQCAKKKNSSLH